MHGIAIPKIGCGLDQKNWQDVVKLLRNIFAYSDVQIVVYSLDEHAIHAMSAEGDPEFFAEDEIDRYSEEFHLNERELETDFTSDNKFCQPDCDEHFPILRPSDDSIFLEDPNWIFSINSLQQLMPKKFESSITHLDDLPEEECNHIPLNCIWPITSQDTNQTVIITCLKWTFNFAFCVRVTAYQLGTPHISTQIDLDDHHPLLRSLTDALRFYEAFPEPHLNSQQLEILEELMEYLHFKF